MGLKATQLQCTGVFAIIKAAKSIANRVISNMTYLKAVVHVTLPAVPYCLRNIAIFHIMKVFSI
jgi:hypothetical protein